MNAYVISEVQVLDEDVANQYRKLAAASIAEFGGRYLARGAIPEVREGEATHRRIAILEFPSMEKAQQWYASEQYAEALKLRGAALARRLMFVEGYAEASWIGAD